MLFRGFSFGGLVAIIFAISPFVSGNGAVGPLATGGGGGGGGGGGMLHGGEMGLGGVGSGRTVRPTSAPIQQVWRYGT
ncbi:hypothetical protein ALC56_04255 [Trachymyrmex septentrionalis]|uniref:Uncharacterized protein n=1 Tax=Trachymyrmex septentrionalis TaxID=34720 RepID=A0A195FMB0_9HYME|nr:hypothetical protein ALC56_04255 [Trachymyrmex septentrionalis]